MQQTQSTYAFGTVIVPTTGTPRYLEFYQSLERLQVPWGTRLSYAKSSDLTLGLNLAFSEFIGEWLFLMGDDHRFHPNILMRLLSYQLPAVVALNIQRETPYHPVISKGVGQGLAEWSEIPVGTGLWYPPKEWLPGDAGMLIRRSVLDQMSQPLFRAGQFHPAAGMEDLYFMQQVQKITGGVPIDLGSPMEHLNTLGVVPEIQDDKWVVTLTNGRDRIVTLPGLTPPAPGGPSEDEIAGVSSQ